MYRLFRANFTLTLRCDVNSGRKWEFQYQRGIANGTYVHSCTGRARVSARARRPRGRSPGRRARVWTTRAEQRCARVEQLCVGVEQRWQGLRSVTPSPHAAGAQRLTLKGKQTVCPLKSLSRVYQVIPVQNHDGQHPHTPSCSVRSVRARAPLYHVH